VVFDNATGDSPLLTVIGAVPITSLSFQPTALTMNQHDRKNATVTARDAAGTALPNRTCTIQTQDQKIVEVAPRSGRPGSSFTAKTDHNGRIDVDVSSRGQKRTTDVTAVCEGRLAALRVTVQ
jgi:hypothetical protein